MKLPCLPIALVCCLKMARYGYAEPASSAFDSQQEFITELENQMRNLGISTLFSQTYVGETAEAKAMDRSDSDSMLSVVSQDLENALQNAMEMAAAFVGIEAPKVCVSRDFDLQKLDGPQVAQYLSMWTRERSPIRPCWRFCLAGRSSED